MQLGFVLIEQLKKNLSNPPDIDTSHTTYAVVFQLLTFNYPDREQDHRQEGCCSSLTANTMVTTSSFYLLLLLIPINQCSSVFIAPHALTNRIDYSAVNVTVPYTVVVSPDGLNVYTSFESQRGPNGSRQLVVWSHGAEILTLVVSAINLHMPLILRT